MSLIITGKWDGSRVMVKCSECHSDCFWEEAAVVADMACRDVVPLCWECDKSSNDAIPGHFYFLDDHFLLGIGERSFLAEWPGDSLELKQEDLKLTPITAAAYYSLKTGDIRLCTPLSSWTNLHKPTLILEVGEQ